MKSEEGQNSRIASDQGKKRMINEASNRVKGDERRKKLHALQRYLGRAEKAHKKLDFLNSKDARTLQILDEYQHPEQLFVQIGFLPIINIRNRFLCRIVLKIGTLVNK